MLQCKWYIFTVPWFCKKGEAGDISRYDLSLPRLGQGAKAQNLLFWRRWDTECRQSIPLKMYKIYGTSISSCRWIFPKVQAGEVSRCYGVPTLGASGGACVHPRSMCLGPWFRSLARRWPRLSLGPGGQGRSQDGAKGWAARRNRPLGDCLGGYS